MCSGQRRPWYGVGAAAAANGISQRQYWTEVCFGQISILLLLSTTSNQQVLLAFSLEHYYFQNAINILFLSHEKR